MTSSVYSISSDANFLCLGIVKKLLTSNLLERKSNVTVGFENLVREALRKRVDLIRDDKLPDYHYDAGVILSHKKMN